MNTYNRKLTAYYLTAIFSLIFAVIGFSYNTWRLEVTEDNSNIRMASFEVFSHLAKLEQNIYAAHYDQNSIEGSPRKGWVQVGLIVDLSMLISPKVEKNAQDLRSLWSEQWQQIPTQQVTVNQLIKKIDKVRIEIKATLINLQ